MVAVTVAYGMCALGFPSVRLMMTRPRAERDLLMFLASSSTVPSAPVFDTFSEPARSTRYLVAAAMFQSAWQLKFKTKVTRGVKRKHTRVNCCKVLGGKC